MKEFIKKGCCPACGANIFSRTLSDGGEHYCTECGTALVIDSGVYRLLNESEWQELVQTRAAIYNRKLYGRQKSGARQ